MLFAADTIGGKKAHDCHEQFVSTTALIPLPGLVTFHHLSEARGLVTERLPGKKESCVHLCPALSQKTACDHAFFLKMYQV